MVGVPGRAGVCGAAAAALRGAVQGRLHVDVRVDEQSTRPRPRNGARPGHLPGLHGVRHADQRSEPERRGLAVRGDRCGLGAAVDPPGALAALPGLVAVGDWGSAALSAAIALAGLALAWWWWSVALRRSLVTVPSTTAGSSPAGRGHADTSIGVGVAGTARVVAGRDRVLVWRDPMRRMPWLMLI